MPSEEHGRSTNIDVCAACYNNFFFKKIIYANTKYQSTLNLTNINKKNHNKESKKPLYNFFNLKDISVITSC
jgi:hypothetical protein